MVITGIEETFAAAGCQGWLCALPLDGPGEVSLGADDLVVSASVFKVVVALEVQCQFHSGALDPRERMVIKPDNRTPGSTGFSMFSDEVEVSLRDLARVMLSISDNAATDVLLARVGIDAIHARLAGLGLTQTVIVSDLQTTVDSIGQDAGFEDWADMQRQDPLNRGDEVTADVIRRIAACRALQPDQTTRTTPREMATLLRLIWRDEAGPAAACAGVRHLMAEQLTRDRLASGFDADVRVAAKSGTLMGIVRNEVGVVEYPDKERHAVAVFTRAHRPWMGTAVINRAIGGAAAAAVEALRAVPRAASS